MKEAAIYILSIYSLLQAGLLYYFFIYKNKEADREYERKIKEIYDRRRVNETHY